MKDPFRPVNGVEARHMVKKPFEHDRGPDVPQNQLDYLKSVELRQSIHGQNSDFIGTNPVSQDP